jgi:hypothetical protein
MSHKRHVTQAQASFNKAFQFQLFNITREDTAVGTHDAKQQPITMDHYGTRTDTAFYMLLAWEEEGD